MNDLSGEGYGNIRFQRRTCGLNCWLHAEVSLLILLDMKKKRGSLPPKENQCLWQLIQSPYTALIRNICVLGRGDELIGNMLIVQAYRPEVGSLAFTEVRCSSAHL